MNGVLLACTFSWGCETANQLGISQFLKQYAENKGKDLSEQEAKEKLRKLFSYFYYSVIAEANGIEDPFDLRVVEAHWIGNELLEKVDLKAIEKVFKAEEKTYPDQFALAFVIKPLVDSLSAHHNTYAATKKTCQVTVGGKYLYHLSKKRIPATSKHIKNLSKYGKV